MAGKEFFLFAIFVIVSAIAGWVGVWALNYMAR